MVTIFIRKLLRTLEITSRRSREELERRRAEERARQQAEAQRLIEEKRRREQEEQRRAEEERAQAMREAALLQKQVGNRKVFLLSCVIFVDKFGFLFTFLLSVFYPSVQREEELAKEQAQAEQLKQEREMLTQKEEAERQARKKVTTRILKYDRHFCIQLGPHIN